MFIFLRQLQKLNGTATLTLWVLTKGKPILGVRIKDFEKTNIVRV